MEVAAGRARGRRWEQRVLPYVLLVPGLLLLVGMLYPFFLGLYYSFTSYYLQYPHLFKFTGLQNYRRDISSTLDSIGIDTWGADGHVVNKDGEMLGKIVFHPGTPAPEADGSYVIGEFRRDTEAEAAET
jgi:ABC-type sugar transport system permease subunit